MSLKSTDFETIESKDIEGTHQLLKVRMRRDNGIALILAKKDSNSGAVFGGHNWEDLSQHPDIVDEYYTVISTIGQFVAASFKVREKIQKLIEGQN